MQHDEVIWQVINQHFCSYKVKAKTKKEQNFCKHPDSVTGLCNRSACPLANSRYATIVEDKGICYLKIKTIERAHTPNRMWERIKLSRNYAKALEQLDSHLEFFPKFLIHKNKQRLTKIHQYLIRMRKLKLKTRPTIVGINKKIDRREAVRERKAEKAAKINQAITNELITRLKSGMYGDEIVNFPAQEYEKAVGEVGTVDEIEEESEDEDEEEEFVEAYEDDEEEEDIEDLAEEVEYERRMRKRGRGEEDEGDSEEDYDDDDEEEEDSQDSLDEDDFESEEEDDEDDDEEDGEGFEGFEEDDEEDEGDEGKTSKPLPKAAPKKKTKKPVAKKKPKRARGGKLEIEYEPEMEEQGRESLRH